MQNLRILMKLLANSVAAIFTYNRESGIFGMLWNSVANITQGCPWTYGFYAQPHAVVGGFHQATRQNRRFADIIHTTCVTKPAIFDHGNVNVHDVAVFKNLTTRYAVADHMIHGRT